MKERLLGKTLTELQQIAEMLNLPKFNAKQISDWLYKKNIVAFDDMTNLSKKTRNSLAEKYDIGISPPLKMQGSKDGTKKYLFKTVNRNYIETAMIPERNRKTVCVSSQAGCKMGCSFCMTARQGFQGQLTAGEIINQVKSIPESGEISNIVYMGMGEPFDNLNEVLKSLEIFTANWGLAMSPRRITVSTIGILPAMITFLEKSEAHLAVSLHSPFPEERKKLIPAEAAFPIKKIIAVLKRYEFRGQRRLSFEYILFEGLNDSNKHINELTRLLEGLTCRVNLIRFHKLPGTLFKSPGEDTIQNFKERLNNKGILATIRASRGEDINAACGLLSTKELTK
jgi:23S rRNA (adenine2503-C2)-methyltransferase